MSTDVTIERDALETVLAQFDKTIDDQGLIVEDKSGDPVLTPRGEEVAVDDFAGIADGSEIFVDDNFVSLVDYVESS